MTYFLEIAILFFLLGSIVSVWWLTDDSDVCPKCQGHQYLTKNQDRKGNFIWKCNCK